MSIAFRLDGALLPFETVRLNGTGGGVGGLPASAWYGEPMVATIQIEDTAGSLAIDGWHTFTVEESACSKPRIFTGWVFGREISRGDNYLLAASRIWDCEIIDQNALFSFEVFRSTAASVYPTQTDLQRIEQARASHAMAGTPIIDNGRVSATNPVNLTPINVVGQYPVELFMSTAGTAGKNFYAYWDESADEISLHYAPVGTGPAATISVSNVNADVNGTTVFAPSSDARLKLSPDNLYTGLLLGYAGGRWVYARNDDLIDELSPFLRDAVYTSDRIGLTSTATALVQRYLEDRSVEKETLTFTVTLPASVVNLAHAGDVLTVKFSHLPGYTTNTDVLIIRRNVVPHDGQDALYDVNFECANYGTDRGPGGGPGGPLQSSCDVDDLSLVQTKTAVPTEDTGTTSHITLDSAPTPGNLQIVITEYDDPVAPTNSLVPDGYTAVTGILSSSATDQNYQVQAWRRVAQTGDTTTLTQTKAGSSARRVTYLEFGGTVDFDTFDTEQVDTDDPSPLVAGTVTPTTGAVVLLISAIVPSLNVGDGWVPTAGGGATTAVSYGSVGASPYIWTGYQFVASATGSYSHTVTYTDGGILRGYAGVMMAFECSATDTPPPHLTVVRNEQVGIGDGTTVTFTTEFPYETGSLEVYVDLLDQTGAVTSFNPATGSFTLGFAPKLGEVVTVTYLTGAG